MNAINGRCLSFHLLVAASLLLIFVSQTSTVSPAQGRADHGHSRTTSRIFSVYRSKRNGYATTDSAPEHVPPGNVSAEQPELVGNNVKTKAALNSNNDVNNTAPLNELPDDSGQQKQRLSREAAKSRRRLNETLDELNESCFLYIPDEAGSRSSPELETMPYYKLVEYTLSLPGYEIIDEALLSESIISYKPQSWTHVRNIHGETLLALSFNYEILSLMTLSVGKLSRSVKLDDEPSGCFANLTEPERLETIFRALRRNIQVESKYEKLCHMAVENRNGYARFVQRCRSILEQEGNNTVEWVPVDPNFWLRLLQWALTTVRLVVFFFGPLFVASSVVSATRKQYPYIVELKEPLTKTILLKTSDAQQDEVAYRQRLDLRNVEGFPKFLECVGAVKHNVPVQVHIKQYDIRVDYNRLMTEHKAPVGFWRSIFASIFLCRIRFVDPFMKCCYTDIFKLCRPYMTSHARRLPWIFLFSKLALILLVCAAPAPYYLRLMIYFVWEQDEVLLRKDVAKRHGLKEMFFSGSLVHFLTPMHTAFVIMYIIYFFTAVVIGLTRDRNRGGDSPLIRIFSGSFDDLQHLPWTTVLGVMTRNVIWPFKRHGVIGFPLALVYWPVVLPITLVLYAFYCLPTIYLTVRMVFYSRRNFLARPPPSRSKTRRSSVPYRLSRRPEDSIRCFDVERLCPRVFNDKGAHAAIVNEIKTNDDVEKEFASFQRRASMQAAPDTVDTVSVKSTLSRAAARRRCRDCIRNSLASGLCVLALYSVLIIASDCVGCFIEMAVFTLMGIIVNAEVLLKYVALVVLLLVYSYDCFNGVQINYLKLNKALFKEVKDRIKDIEKVTSMPAYLQENYGFKSQELSEQADYEKPDDVTSAPHRHWLINDLVLFVDNEDTPRIPRKIFEEVCEIRVSGVPGPVYRGHLIALTQFLKIVFFVFFVFVVVLSFGSAYDMSSTNQTLAALAGGFVPLLLRTLMGSGTPDIDLGSLSFKSKLDEVIKNFYQFWPMYDFAFKPVSADTESVTSRDSDSVDLKTSASRKTSAVVHPGSAASLLKSSAVVEQPSDSQAKPVHAKLSELRGSQSHESLARISRTSEQNRVAFTGEEVTAKKPVVDILINLPQNTDNLWLDEWSDLN